MDQIDSEKSGIADETLIVSGGQGDCDPQDFISPGEQNSEIGQTLSRGCGCVVVCVWVVVVVVVGGGEDAQ